MQEPIASGLARSAHAAPAQQFTQLQYVWLRLRQNNAALLGVFILLLMVALAACASVITPENPYDGTTWDVTNQSLSPRLSPAWYFILGTDTSGHLLLSQIAYGARVSLAVGFFGTLSAVVVGSIVGALAGYFGGWVDSLLMRLADAFLVLPFLPLVIMAASVFGATDVWSMTHIFAAFAWPMAARMARVAFLELRTTEYAESARAVGVGHVRIVLKHLLPNTIGPIAIAATITAASCITAEAVIDFLMGNKGIHYPDVSWGSILLAARAALGTSNWWWPVFPGLALLLTVLAVYLVGSGLEDAFEAQG